MVKVAVAQFSGNTNRQTNVDTAERLARKAADEGGRVVCFPELASSIYFCYDRSPKYFELAEPIDGPSVTQMRGVARETRTVLVYPFYELDAGHHRFNSAAVIGPDGELIGKYRKSSIPAILRMRTDGETPGDRTASSSAS